MEFVLNMDVSKYTPEVIAMTVGKKGKNFINWTESNDGIEKIWHNRKNNNIEITSKNEKHDDLEKVKEVIKKVLDFNQEFVQEKQLNENIAHSIMK
jgi:hypothetical protein